MKDRVTRVERFSGVTDLRLMTVYTTSVVFLLPYLGTGNRLREWEEVLVCLSVDSTTDSKEMTWSRIPHLYPWSLLSQEVVEDLKGTSGCSRSLDGTAWFGSDKPIPQVFLRADLACPERLQKATQDSDQTQNPFPRTMVVSEEGTWSLKDQSSWQVSLRTISGEESCSSLTRHRFRVPLWEIENGLFWWVVKEMIRVKGLVWKWGKILKEQKLERRRHDGAIFEPETETE